MNPFDLGDHLPTILAQRVSLRWLTGDDVPALFEVFGDREVMRYWSHEPLANVAEAREYLRDIQACFARRELFQWGIELVDAASAARWQNARDTDSAAASAGEGGVIGTCTLAKLDADHRRAELGFALARRHWGHGYIAEAASALLDFAFTTLRLQRLTADADPRNKRSIRVLERLGFQREGYLRAHYMVGGEKQDAILFGLLRGQWGRRGR
jgi:RimJ/RimL family protein N-acetyltransferase